MKKIVITLLKFAVSFAILGYLFHENRDTFDQLLDQPKEWNQLALAWLLVMLIAVGTFSRWYFLVRALRLQFSMRDALRLGFLGFLFNFLSLGIAGGDLIRIVFLAREQKGKRTEAIATVVLDRLLGLYAMMMVATVAFLSVNLYQLSVRDPELLAAVQLIGQVAVILTAAGTIALCIAFWPGMAASKSWDSLARIPLVGNTLQRLVITVRTYQKNPGTLLLAIFMSVGVHVIFCVAIYLIARGLLGDSPSLSTHFVIVPIANAANAVPLPGGLGAFEAALTAVYNAVSAEGALEGQGLIVAVSYRLITLTVAVVGVFYWIAGRRQVAELLKEAQAEHSS